MTNIHAYATQYTRQMMDPDHKGEPTVNMSNGKPYRTKAQKAEARTTAKKRADGAYRSSAPRTYHKPFTTKPPREGCASHKCICR